MSELLICADLCSNHHVDKSIAKNMVRYAAEAGADIIKVQEDDGFDAEFHEELFALIHDLGKKTALTVRTTGPWSRSSDYLKIGSGGCLNLNLIDRVKKDGRPWIISTGALERDKYTLLEGLCSSVSGIYRDAIICECNPSYASEIRLGWLRDAGIRGYSDHMPSIHMALAAIALGATYVEKHFTLFQADKLGRNHSSSIGRVQLADLVKQGREIFDALSHTDKGVQKRELEKGAADSDSKPAVHD